MTLSFSLTDLLLYQVALAAMFSPFAVIGPFSVLTGEYSQKVQRKVVLRVSLYSTVFLLITSLTGEALLRALGISIEALSAAGGLVLILSALPMVLKGESPRRPAKTAVETDLDEEWASQIVTPLVFPLTMGAGSISLVITQVGAAQSIFDRLILCVVILIHGGIIYTTYRLSVPFSGRIGGRGSAILTRVGGIILLSLAFMIFTNGLKVLLPGLAG